MVRPPYWIGWRLIDLAVTHWPAFHGQTLLAMGRDPLELPLPALLNVIYAWWIGDALDDEVRTFDTELAAAPRTAALEEQPEWSDQATDESFMRALAGRSGG